VTRLPTTTKDRAHFAKAFVAVLFACVHNAGRSQMAAAG
jgi:hypothetical protein